MRNTTRAIAAAIIVATAPRLLLAADAPAAAPAPAAVPGLADLLTGWGLTTSGGIAASYYHSNGYPGSTWRAFDQNHDSFQLDEASLQLGYQPKTGIGGYVDVIAGTDAQILSLNEGGSGEAIGVRQAYLQYATGPLTVIAGKYLTLAGAEVINPTANTNYSRSLLFWLLEPLDHTGLRATYAVSDTFNFIVGVNNGWNVTNTDFGSKTVEVGATWAPSKMFSFATTLYDGKIPSGGNLSLFDFVGTVNVTSALSVVLNIDAYQLYGDTSPNPGHVNGAALYFNYGFTDSFRVSLRTEYLDYREIGHATEGTLTLGYSPVKNFEIRGEVRYDSLSAGLTNSGFAYTRALPNNDAETPAVLADNNTEFAIQGVYKFALP